MEMAGKWEFPGGKIEAGETPAECVVRELREELGVRAAILAEIARVRHDYPDFTMILHVFVCAVPDGAEPASREHDDAGWRTYEELCRLEWDECDRKFFPALKSWLESRADPAEPRSRSGPD